MKYREGASGNSSPVSILGQLFIASVQNCETITAKIATHRRNIVPYKRLFLNVESNNYRFVYALLRSVIGPEKLAPLSQPIRFKAKNQSGLCHPRFSAFQEVWLFFTWTCHMALRGRSCC